MRFDHYQDMSSQWRWRIVADNGRIVADSSEGYVSKSNAERASNMLVEAFKSGVDSDLAQERAAKQEADAIRARQEAQQQSTRRTP